MDFKFKSKKMKKICSDKSKMDREWGTYNAKKLQIRINQIKAADSLEVLFTLPGARCHQLKGNRDNQFAVDLKHPFRLIFEPYHDPVPLKEDGGFDTAKITDILLLEVRDYHD
ncbi:type II toxin-antitoxin system RelE/ParE family toxin [Aureibacillus halotolerans]|uniref:Proteic killer suppression protein n=1 Tax=Aureibacillus halotolerans TaxID=1508390 RepID=A0A4V3D4E3_9BACI|nr:type II toxin-antitoxin system RelE/ParE family toxin [Aureibacillus halotolerans]TDQ35308.1 proteic killer suppression protein [Aureibacillus halotolerans]